VTDEATAALLSKLPLDSDIQKAKTAFDQAQAVEEQFLSDFDGIDFSVRNKGGLLCQNRRRLVADQ